MGSSRIKGVFVGGAVIAAAMFGVAQRADGQPTQVWGKKYPDPITTGFFDTAVGVSGSINSLTGAAHTYAAGSVATSSSVDEFLVNKYDLVSGTLIQSSPWPAPGNVAHRTAIAMKSAIGGAGDTSFVAVTGKVVDHTRGDAWSTVTVVWAEGLGGLSPVGPAWIADAASGVDEVPVALCIDTQQTYVAVVAEVKVSTTQTDLITAAYSLSDMSVVLKPQHYSNGGINSAADVFVGDNHDVFVTGTVPHGDGTHTDIIVLGYDTSTPTGGYLLGWPQTFNTANASNTAAAFATETSAAGTPPAEVPIYVVGSQLLDSGTWHFLTIGYPLTGGTATWSATAGVSGRNQMALRGAVLDVVSPGPSVPAGIYVAVTGWAEGVTTASKRQFFTKLYRDNGGTISDLWTVGARWPLEGDMQPGDKNEPSDIAIHGDFGWANNSVPGSDAARMIISGYTPDPTYGSSDYVALKYDIAPSTPNKSSVWTKLQDGGGGATNLPGRFFALIAPAFSPYASELYYGMTGTSNFSTAQQWLTAMFREYSPQ